jgi:hypothetical protein
MEVFMYCPKCRYEYVQGVKECPDCRVELVEELAAESHEPEHNYIEIVSTLNLGDVTLIKSLLDANEIDYRVFDENFNTIRPLVQPARFFVREDQVDEVKKLLEGMDIHAFALSTRKNKEED